MALDLYIFKTTDITGANKYDVVDKIDENPPVLDDSELEKFIKVVLKKYPEPEEDYFKEETDYWEPPGLIKEFTNVYFGHINDFQLQETLEEMIEFLIYQSVKYNVHIYSPSTGKFLLENVYDMYMSLKTGDFNKIPKSNNIVIVNKILKVLFFTILFLSLFILIPWVNSLQR